MICDLEIMDELLAVVSWSLNVNAKLYCPPQLCTLN